VKTPDQKQKQDIGRVRNGKNNLWYRGENEYHIDFLNLNFGFDSQRYRQFFVDSSKKSVRVEK
jgi:hypothetical protein